MIAGFLWTEISFVERQANALDVRLAVVEQRLESIDATLMRIEQRLTAPSP